MERVAPLDPAPLETRTRGAVDVCAERMLAGL